MMFKMELMPPPQAGHGEKAWDDGGRGQVAGIFISYSSPPSGDDDDDDPEYKINSLRFLYSKNNALQFSEEHGTRAGNSEMIRLDYPGEFLTSVRGLYCDTNWVTGNEVTSMTFETNKATYGPFGMPKKDSDNHAFNYRLGSRDQIDGFHGTVNRDGSIGSIGIYLQTETAGTSQQHAAAASRCVKSESDRI